MSHTRLAVNLALTVCLAATGRTQAPTTNPYTGKHGESVRVALGGAPGLQRRLAELGVVGDHVIPSSKPGWETVEVVLERIELARLRAQLPKHTLVLVLEESRPFEEIAAARRQHLNPDPNYHTRAEVIADLRKFEKDYPKLAKLYDLQSRYGTPLSHDGYRLYALRISNAPDKDQDKPSIAVTANTHAGELATIEVPLFTANKLLTGYGKDVALTKLVNDNQIWIIPNLNPDGLEYTWKTNNLWRKNRRNNGGGVYGVDMNRNYPFYWGRCGSSTSTSSSTYRGPSVASEPEVQAVLKFAEAEGLERLLDFHCTGPDVRHPFNSLVVNSIPAMIRSTMIPLQIDIAKAMNYGVRGTCCCGTHMEWHHAVNGTMAFLVEFAACSGPFAGTVTALNNAWPGVKKFLEQPVPLTGHVRSSVGGSPLRASITVGGQPFQHGQTTLSGGRFGRYQLWGGPGTFDVTFTARDHKPVTVRVTLTAGQTVVKDVVLPFAPTGSHESYGIGCAGSGKRPGSCISSNSNGGTLSGHKSTNEYAYTVNNSNAITVTGFKLYTAATGTTPTTVLAHLYRATSSGDPASQPVASGKMTVGLTVSFYEVKLATPVAIAANSTFFIASDTTTIITSTLTSGTAGGGFWRRPPRSGSWAASGIVKFPSYQVLCQHGGKPGAIPVLSSNDVPKLGANFGLRLAQAAPNAPAMLVIGASRTAWGTVPLPLNLGPFGAPGCSLLASLEFLMQTRTDGNGTATLQFSVPNRAALVGTTFFDQFVVADPTINAMGLVVSNGGTGKIGF
jgi:predicted deacylase